MHRFFVKNAPVDLKPSFVRTVGVFYATFVVLFALSYVTGASSKYAGAAQGAWIGLLIVPGALGSLIWFFFVPRKFEFSSRDITIQPALESLRTFDWDELEYFGPGRGVYVLQFHGYTTIQIFTFGFRRSQWRLLKRFLYENYPERVGSLLVAGRFIT